MVSSFTPTQRDVLRAFHDFGRPLDDKTLEVYVHHIGTNAGSSSSIRSRRAELQRSGYLKVVGYKPQRSGRKAAVHALTPAGRKIAKSLV